MIQTPASHPVVLRAKGITVSTAAGELVRSIDLTLRSGQIHALAGESGSGKTLTALSLLGLLPPGLSAAGQIELPEHDITLSLTDHRAVNSPGSHSTSANRPLMGTRKTTKQHRAVRGAIISLLLQDPFTAFSPTHPVGQQLAWGAPGGRLKSSQIVAALAEVELPERVAQQFPHELSGGMLQRVALAAALIASPDILVADEPTTALDASTRMGILNLLHRLRQERQLAIIIITHDLELIRHHADTVDILYAGSVVERGPVASVFNHPIHPYTRFLRAATPRIGADTLPTDLSHHGGVELPPHHDFGWGHATAEELRRQRRPKLVQVDVEHEVALYPRDSGEQPCDIPEPPVPRTPSGAVIDRPSSRPDPARNPALELAGLTVHYGAQTALEDVSMRVEVGQIVGLVGESGSGKTTLGRCAVGLITPDAGEVRVAGQPLPPLTRRHRVTANKTSAQLIFQNPQQALNPRHTVRRTLNEALRVVNSRTTPDPSATTAAELLIQVGLPENLLDRYPAALSGGQRQRVSIARALALNPTALVCDEPTSALDVSVQAEILTLLDHLRTEQGLGIIFISHDLAAVHQIADRIHVLHQGRIVESGTRDDVLLTPSHPYTRMLVDAAAHQPQSVHL